MDIIGVLKSPAVTVFPSVPPSTSVSICLMYLGAPFYCFSVTLTQGYQSY